MKCGQFKLIIYIPFLIGLNSCDDIELTTNEFIETFGGDSYDTGMSITNTQDGGYILTGSYASNEGDFNGLNRGYEDIFVMKLNSSGKQQWMKTYGGSQKDVGTSITETEDGGYLLTGASASNDGDFSGINKNKYEGVIILKLNALGEKEWIVDYGGGSGHGTSIIQTRDNAFVLTGYGSYLLNKDVFVIKLNSSGQQEWINTIGGSSEYGEGGNSIIQTQSGEYILTGTFNSNDGDFNGMHRGNGDIFICNLNSFGEVNWIKSYGGSYSDGGRSITEIQNGGYVVTGGSRSVDGDFIGINKGDTDIFAININSSGETKWIKTFGGTSYETGLSILPTQDGGTAVTGSFHSNVGDFKGLNRGGTDIFVIELNSIGEVKWIRTFGGSSDEGGNCITQTHDGGFVLTGESASTDGDFNGLINGDFNGVNNGPHDIFVIRF